MEFTDFDGDWAALDNNYTQARRRLFRNPRWLFGPLHALDTLKMFCRPRNDIRGKRCCDLGCGVDSFFGPAALLYINGAASVLALDIESPKDIQRTAESLYDLLVSCLVSPDSFHLSKVERQIFIDRIHQFDLQELRDGNLWGGCKSIALQHTVGDIYGEPFRSGQFDLIFSRASLEHFSDLEYAAAALFNSTAPGGINDHLVDFTDHRCYTSPDYHQWSFLAEDGDWLKGVHPANRVNRLRLSDVKGIFERAGFVVEILRSDKKPLPPGLINELHPDFAKYSLSDLETLVARIVAVKP